MFQRRIGHRDRNGTAQRERRARRRQHKPPRRSDWNLYMSDGASRGQGTDGTVLGGWGAVYFNAESTSDIPTAMSWNFLGEDVTNNVAEYLGAIAAFEHAVTHSEGDCCFQMDSLLVCNHVTCRWACREASFWPFLERIWSLIRLLESRGSMVLIEHVYREHNRWADAAANKSVDERAFRAWQEVPEQWVHGLPPL